MISGYAIEQVFLRLRGGMVQLEFVHVALSGALRREKLTYPTRNPIDAVRRSAKQLAERGDIDDASKLRLRIERNGELKDDASLKRMFQSEFEQHYDALFDDD